MYYVNASVKFYSPETGGRQVMPTGDGYAPYLRTERHISDRAVRIYGIAEGAHFRQPLKVDIELCYHPEIDFTDLNTGVLFKLCEGKKIIAEGVILSSVLQK